MTARGLRLKPSRVKRLPEAAKRLLRSRIIAGDTHEEIADRLQEAGFPVLSRDDVDWFRVRDPEIRVVFTWMQTQLNDRGSHPLATLPGLVEFLLQRFGQMDKWQFLREDINPLTEDGSRSCFTLREKLRGSAMARGVISRLHNILRGWYSLQKIEQTPCEGPVMPRFMKSEAFALKIPDDKCWPYDELLYADDRDLLSMEIDGEWKSAWTPIPHLRVLQELEKVFPDKARRMKEAILRSSSPERGLWSVDVDGRSPLSFPVRPPAREPAAATSKKPSRRRNDAGKKGCATGPAGADSAIGSVDELLARARRAMELKERIEGFETEAETFAGGHENAPSHEGKSDAGVTNTPANTPANTPVDTPADTPTDTPGTAPMTSVDRVIG